MRNCLKNSMFLFHKIREYSKSYFIVVLLVSLTAFAGPLSTVLMPKLITDALIKHKNSQYILGLIIVTVSVNALRIIVRTIYNEIYVPYNQNKIRRGINSLLMQKARKLDLKCYDDPEFYNRYTRALGQADEGLISFIDNYTTLIDRFVYIATVISIVITLDPVLIIFALICVVALFFFSKYISQYRYDTMVLTTKDSRCSDYSKRIHYLSDYSKEIRTTNIGEMIARKYYDANKSIQNTVLKRSGKITALTLADEGVRLFVLQLLTMIYLTYKIMHGYMDASSFIALFLAITQLTYELFSFVHCINDFYKLSLHTEDLVYIINYSSEIEKNDTIEDSNNNISHVDSIVFDNVNFSYNGTKEVLEDLKISISSGEHIAIVGYNGAGKSTITKLLLRLYDPSRGDIFVNGSKLTDININSY